MVEILHHPALWFFVGILLGAWAMDLVIRRTRCENCCVKG